MNSTADPFQPSQPNSTDTLIIPTENLSKNEAKTFQEVIDEWTRAPTLDALLNDWVDHRTKTTSMMNKKGEISFLLLNVSSLSRHLVDVYELLNRVDAPFVMLTGTHHDDKTIKLFSSHYSNVNVFSMRGTNPVGGVLVAVHKSIRASRTRPYDTENLIVLEIGEATESFQLVACYSPPTEPLSLLTFDEILLRSRNTIFMGDFDAKHQSWSTPTVNQKGRALYDWLTARNHNLSFEVVNRCVSTSTRSTATIDLVIAPSHMSSTVFDVLPSMGSDHYPVVWHPSFKMSALHLRQPIKRTHCSLVERFLTLTFFFWNSLSKAMPDASKFFCLYERFLSLCAARFTVVSFRKSYKPSLPPLLVELIKYKRYCLNLFRKTRHPYFVNLLREYDKTTRREMFAHKRESWANYCSTLNHLDSESFWRKAKRHFSSCSSPIEGFLLNGVVVSLP